MVIAIYPEYESGYSHLLQDLSRLHASLDIDEDPYIASLRDQDHERYFHVRRTRKTFCQDQMKRFIHMATNVNHELGPWMSDLYVILCIQRVQRRREAAITLLQNIEEAEKIYLSKQLNLLTLPSIEDHLRLPSFDLSPKLDQLLGILKKEMTPNAAGIVFVKTRASAKLLSVLLAVHPQTQNLRIGTFVGTSNNQAHKSYISDLSDAREQRETLNDLRSGVKNLIITTSVCEEGIDIAVCNVVVCFESPPNLKSFIQRRGRARSITSKYIIMFSKGQEKLLVEWERLEIEMRQKYMDGMRDIEKIDRLEEQETGHREFRVESTE